MRVGIIVKKPIEPQDLCIAKVNNKEREKNDPN